MKNALVFIAGITVGSAVTWYMTKTYYQQIADEEIESVKEEFLKIKKEVPDDSENETCKKEESVIDQERQTYSQVLKDSGYIDNDMDSEHGGAEPGIDIIPPSEAGEEISYGYDSLNYYSDGILALERNDEIIRDIQGTISELSLRSFGLYEPDTITVCNHNQEMYYEIHRCSCTYAQGAGMDPE